MRRYSAVCMGILFFGAISVAPGRTVADECVVNLNRGKHNCADISEIEIKELVEGRRGTGQAVVKVTLDGAVNPTGYTEATFRVKYSTIAEGWTVNIGDSESNNGYRGDAAHQSNDAEMQILRSSLESPNALTVYGNDYRPEEELNPLLRYTLKGDRPNITLTVKNQFFGWERRGNIGKMKSEFLYALDGQLDDEGPENYDVYAAFNRTIGNASRDGKGVGKVIIELKRDPDTPVLPSVPTVTSLTGRVWMDRNLGASRVATSPTDTEAYGDLYQWGRLTDGHENRYSLTTTETSSSDQPGHDKFILNNTGTYDWRVPQNNDLWQGVNGINNPCPEGFRLPTEQEFLNERATWDTKDVAGAFNNPLKLPAAGLRYLPNGTLAQEGEIGYYWVYTLNFTDAGNYMVITPDMAVMNGSARAYGHSIRCIQALPEEL
ncbi:MAG: hypothetical protein V8K32_09250 [Candidatus Electrothrix gigas]